MANGYIFSGESKTILLTGTGTTTMEDMYSRWKEWVLIDTNSKFLQAFRYVGGDPTVGDASLGITYFLTNGWRIKPFEADHVLDVLGNLYVDGGGNPFLQTDGDYRVLVRLNVSNLVDARVLQSETEKALEYNGVHIDTFLGSPGTEHPVGTLSVPSNNSVALL